MTRLYTDLAAHYHAMYRHIFDYDAEFARFDALLRAHDAHRVLELGAGSGMLGRRLIAAGYDYTGVDLAPQMVNIAREETGSDRFFVGDMRDLDVDGPFDAVLITGRSLSYVLHTNEVLATLRGVRAALREGGLLWFDVFDAEGIFADFRASGEHEVADGVTTWRRTNTLAPNLASGWTWDWHAVLDVTGPDGAQTFEDDTTLRAFLPDELRLLLRLAGFDGATIVATPRVLTVTSAAQP